MHIPTNFHFMKFQNFYRGFPVKAEPPNWGPMRKRWLSNISGLLALNAVCDNNPQHDGFQPSKSSAGVWSFPTASEAAYPTLLCNRMAEKIVEALLEKGFTNMPATIHTADNNPGMKILRRRASVGLFVRGNRLAQLVGEYARVAKLPWPLPLPAIGSVITMPSDKNDPVHAKVLQHNVGVQNELTEHTTITVGIYRTPTEFAHEASLSVHPMDLMTSTCDATKRNLFWMLTTGPSEVAKYRIDMMRELRARVASFGSLEASDHENLPPECRSVLAGKNLRALYSILEDAGYPDLAIIDEIRHGLAITGPMTDSGIFPPKSRPATITVEQLAASSSSCRAGILGKVGPSTDPDIDLAVWNETKEEEGKGWIEGPYTSDQLESKFPNGWIVSRRFGIKQAGKIRNIDDYTESMANGSVSTSEKISLMGIDDLVAVSKMGIEAVRDDRSVCVVMDSGEKLTGKLPPEVSIDEARSWGGKTVDLKSAYRQLPCKPSEAWATIIAVYCPEDKSAKPYIQRALPFGATGSVSKFNRAARSLWAAVSFWLRLAWTNFYDDFPVLELLANAQASDIAIRTVFVLLGWKVTTDPMKCFPFQSEFVVLGAVVDLSDSNKKTIRVKNKHSRILGVTQEINDVLADGKCSPHRTAELRGKGQFAANQMFSRIACGALHALTTHQFKSRSSVLSNDSRRALLRLVDLLNSASPRTLLCGGDPRPLLIFSDVLAKELSGAMSQWEPLYSTPHL